MLQSVREVSSEIFFRATQQNVQKEGSKKNWLNREMGFLIVIFLNGTNRDTISYVQESITGIENGINFTVFPRALSEIFDQSRSGIFPNGKNTKTTLFNDEQGERA